MVDKLKKFQSDLNVGDGTFKMIMREIKKGYDAWFIVERLAKCGFKNPEHKMDLINDYRRTNPWGV